MIHQRICNAEAAPPRGHAAGEGQRPQVDRPFIAPSRAVLIGAIAAVGVLSVSAHAEADQPCACAAPQPNAQPTPTSDDPYDKLIEYLECLIRRLLGLPCAGDPPTDP